MRKEENKRARRYPAGFQQAAVERMKHCEDISKLAEELGVSRGVLYLWQRRAENLPSYSIAKRRGQLPDDPQARKIREQEARIAQIEGELGRQSLETRFFKSALRKVEGLRRQNEQTGGTESTTKSPAGKRKAD